MFWARIALFLALLVSPALAQTNPGFVTGAILCANTGDVACQNVTPANPLGLNQAFINKLDTFNSTFGGASYAVALAATCAQPVGVRGPLYICNDNNGVSAAGQALIFQGWVGATPTATPAANQAVAMLLAIDNLNGRQGTWALNIVCNSQPVSAGGSVAINHCFEGDLTQSQVASVPLSAFSQGAVSHFAEGVCSQNMSVSPQPCQAAFWVWAAGDYANSGASQFQPWNFGFAASRVQQAGFDCEINPRGAADTGTYFKQGCLWDQSNSVVSYRASGTHTSMLDVSAATFTNFLNCGAVTCGIAGSVNIKGPGASSATTVLTLQNSVPTTFVSFRDDGLATFGGSQLFNAAVTIGGYNATSGGFALAVNNITPANLFTVRNDGAITMPLLPTSAGGGGVNVCVDSVGALYKKAACP